MNYTAIEEQRLANIKVVLKDSNGREGIVPLLFAKSSECMKAESGETEKRTEVEQVQFNFLINKRLFSDRFRMVLIFVAFVTVLSSFLSPFVTILSKPS